MTESRPALATSLARAVASTEARHSLPIGVIGAGRLGSALAGALVAAGYARVRIASRTEARAREVAAALGVEQRPTAVLVEESALVVLAVPDRAIAALAAGLAWGAGQGVVHCSGALALEVLAVAAARDVLAGCLHPLQTFPITLSPSGPQASADLFNRITCGVEGAAPLGDLLAAIAEDLGARTVRLEGVDRARYHAAAVLVSNDVVALMAAATRAWTRAGLPQEDAREALAPLLLAAAANVAQLPLPQALTGPVARGDTETVARHLRALAEDAGLSNVYRGLARELLRLNLGHPPEVVAALEALLRDP